MTKLPIIIKDGFNRVYINNKQFACSCGSIVHKNETA